MMRCHGMAVGGLSALLPPAPAQRVTWGLRGPSKRARKAGNVFNKERLGLNLKKYREKEQMGESRVWAPRLGGGILQQRRLVR